MRALLGIAGGIGSGKSSVASALAAELNGERRSFGDAVRAEALRRHLGDDRRALQDLGNQLISEGWASFVKLVVGTVSYDDELVIVDGIRHRDAIEALRLASDDRHVLTVFIHTSRNLRVERLINRDGISRAAVESAMAHPNEREVEALMELADLVVENELAIDVKTLAATVIAQLSHC